VLLPRFRVIGVCRAKALLPQLVVAGLKPWFLFVAVSVGLKRCCRVIGACKAKALLPVFVGLKPYLHLLLFL